MTQAFVFHSQSRVLLVSMDKRNLCSFHIKMANNTLKYKPFTIINAFLHIEIEGDLITTEIMSVIYTNTGNNITQELDLLKASQTGVLLHTQKGFLFELRYGLAKQHSQFTNTSLHFNFIKKYKLKAEFWLAYHPSGYQPMSKIGEMFIFSKKYRFFSFERVSALIYILVCFSTVKRFSLSFIE